MICLMSIVPPYMPLHAFIAYYDIETKSAGVKPGNAAN